MDLFGEGGVHPPEACDQVAGATVQIFQISPPQARNTNYAALMMPRLHRSGFNPSLGPCKRAWNNNVEKYASFWDPTPFLKALVETSFEQLSENVQLLRTHLIVACILDLCVCVCVCWVKRLSFR